MRHLSQDDIGKKVEVYYNLHTHMWSVRYRGLVIGHTKSLRLDGVIFKVSQAGRARVIREGKKNVHAFCVGTLSAYGDFIGHEYPGIAITYNPYKYASFVRVLSHEPVCSADVAWLNAKLVTVQGRIA